MSRRTLSPRTSLGPVITRALRRARPYLPAIVLAAATAAFLVSAIAAARPGGGSSFGGGSRSGGGSSGGHSGGGGSGGGDCFWIIEIIVFLVQLTIEHPAIGIPLDIGIAAVLIWAYRSQQDKKNKTDWSTIQTRAAHAAGGAGSTPRHVERPSQSVRRQLYRDVATTDPEFSLVLFEDFFYALYATVHTARGAHRTSTLVPYLRPAARESIERSSQSLEGVKAIVIGALRYKDISGLARDRYSVTLEIEANYTETVGGRDQAYYVVERWTLSRAVTARSRRPDTASTIGCPNCGAPLDGLRGNVCGYCNTAVDTGALDWMVEDIRVVEREPRPPQLTGDTEERGTHLPTVVDPDAQVRYQALLHRDPGLSWERITGRIGLIFSEMQVSWSTLDWSRARPFVSDQLFQMLSYWIETYRRSRMRNVTERARITRIEVASVMNDRYYDALTVRVHATGLDYTITDAGQVVGGSRSVEREYTEYWTLIRGNGARTRDISDRVCPNCGAPLQINMAGHCGVCKVKVTAGQFDWVLSRIEQDEAYG